MKETSMNVGKEIARHLAAIQNEDAEDKMRQLRRSAMKILRTIPSGTADAALTPEQRQAWIDHDQALAWFED